MSPYDICRIVVLVGMFLRNTGTYLFTKLDGVASRKSVIFVSSPLEPKAFLRLLFRAHSLILLLPSIHTHRSCHLQCTLATVLSQDQHLCAVPTDICTPEFTFVKCLMDT